MDTPMPNHTSKRGVHVPQDVKDYIIKKVKEGSKTVPEIAKECGVGKTAIYSWLEGSTGTTASEVTKLKREIVQLKSLVAELSLMVHTAQKKSW
jgi:transposase-like protein